MVGRQRLASRHGHSVRFALLAASVLAVVVEIALAEPAAVPSDPHFVSRVIVGPIQGERRYLVFLPRRFSREQRPPVIMVLNGFGQNGEDGFRQISNNFGVDVWRMRDMYPFVVVAPQCRSSGSWTDPHGEGKLAMDVLAEVEKEYDTDPDRVYLTGISSGGAGVFSVASHHPERFAAIVPLCGAKGASSHVLAEANLPMWNFYNDGDRPPLVEYNRTLREQLIKLGRSPLATEYHASGHNCWTRAYATKGLYAWMLAQNRRKNREDAGRFTLVEPQEIVERWERRGGEEWHVEEAALVGAAIPEPDGARHSHAHVQGLESEGAVVSAEAFGDFEFHLDATWSSDQTLRIGLFGGNGTSRPALTLSIPFAGSGFGGIAADGGVSLAVMDPVGQRQLDPKGWNDLRIVRRGDSLSLSINGWLGLECRDARLTGEYRLALFAPTTPESETRWRYVRWRPLQSASISAQPTTDAVASISKTDLGGVHPQSSDSEEDRGGDARSDPAGSTMEQGGNGEGLDAVKAAWRARESAVPALDVRWTIRWDEFTRFGGYPQGGEPVDRIQQPMDRLLVDGARWRFDGLRPAPGRSGAFEDYLGEAGFSTLLQSGRLPKYNASAALVPFSQWDVEERVTRLWTGKKDDPPQAIIEETRGSLPERASRQSGPARLQDLLLEGILLSLRPLTFGPFRAAPDHCRFVDERSTKGVCYAVLEQRFDSTDKALDGRTRQFWLDPEREYAIVRMIDHLPNGTPDVQFDVRYAARRGADSTRGADQTGASDRSYAADVERLPGDDVPATWVAMTLDQDGDTTSFVYADRTSVSRAASDRDAQLRADIPAGTRVVDRVASQTYVLKSDGSRQVENYEKGRDLRGPPSAAKGRGLRRFLQASLRWPGLLVTFSCVGAIGWSVSRVRRWMRSSPSARTETVA